MGLGWPNVVVQLGPIKRGNDKKNNNSNNVRLVC